MWSQNMYLPFYFEAGAPRVASAEPLVVMPPPVLAVIGDLAAIGAIAECAAPIGAGIEARFIPGRPGNDPFMPEVIIGEK